MLLCIGKYILEKKILICLILPISDNKILNVSG